MYNPANRNIQLGETEGKRFKKLGDFGEILAYQLLADQCFENIINLNEIKNNAPYADFYAVKDGVEYIFSVKARNKYENTGKLNSRYKLGRSGIKLGKFISDEAFKQYCGATPAWLAISMETNTYDAYWGLMSELPGNQHGIPMSESAKKNYKLLAVGVAHPYKSEHFLNVYVNKK